MSVHFDYPSIRDFFEIHGNTSYEKLNDYEHCKAESDRLYNEQLKQSEGEIQTKDQEKTET
ncbi:hypothetical protein [Pedobacter jeongneungensis]|uniref:hypothetical protein n=1 Tax=Pedobacter jeongneungensis TaxID=947309 RepID=UPI0004696CB9|nr:hypothetical protein [Pedobacter jeongneungensis]